MTVLLLVTVGSIITLGLHELAGVGPAGSLSVGAIGLGGMIVTMVRASGYRQQGPGRTDPKRNPRAEEAPNDDQGDRADE
jgi:hypothetical protein